MTLAKAKKIPHAIIPVRLLGSLVDNESNTIEMSACGICKNGKMSRADNRNADDGCCCLACCIFLSLAARSRDKDSTRAMDESSRLYDSTSGSRNTTADARRMRCCCCCCCRIFPPSPDERRAIRTGHESGLDVRFLTTIVGDAVVATMSFWGDDGLDSIDIVGDVARDDVEDVGEKSESACE